MKIDIEASCPTVLLDADSRGLGWERYPEFRDELAAYEFENEECGDGIEAAVFVEARFDTQSGECTVEDVFLFDAVEALIVVLEEAAGVERPVEYDELTGEPWTLRGFCQNDVPYTQVTTAVSGSEITLTIETTHVDPVTVRYRPKALLADLQMIVDDYERLIARFAHGLVENPEHRDLWSGFRSRIEAIQAST